jgi:hypothetical protein
MNDENIPGNDVKSLLDIYSKCLEMMNKKIVNTPESLRLETIKLVEELKKLNSNEFIKFVKANDAWNFTISSTNRVIATFENK